MNNIEINDRSEFAKLVSVIKQAASTYNEVCSNYSNDKVERFIEKLAEDHKVFIKKASSTMNVSDNLPIMNQLKPDAIFDKKSAIDVLLLCKDLEKKILTQAREAVRSCRGNAKKLLCKQLTYSEKALFKADQMLEIYE